MNNRIIYLNDAALATVLRGTDIQGVTRKE